ncbi:hypothetical protein [Comamonas sp. NoAH]|uniref:hypothetical protein n=1 Tax=Comamonas halotolerans TaxID=3041496 RepID=UPI0024E0BD29|nr:hypothetical protein [Comamonas sp. NoAH]
MVLSDLLLIGDDEMFGELFVPTSNVSGFFYKNLNECTSLYQRIDSRLALVSNLQQVLHIHAQTSRRPDVCFFKVLRIALARLDSIALEGLHRESTGTCVVPKVRRYCSRILERAVLRKIMKMGCSASPQNVMDMGRSLFTIETR